MSNFCNPIKGKLTKMKQSFVQRDPLYADQTPTKYTTSFDDNKENRELTTFHRTLTNANSLRKLDLLEKKSCRKQDSIDFYRK